MPCGVSASAKQLLYEWIMPIEDILYPTNDFIGLQVAIMHQEVHQYANEGSKEDDCRQLNKDVNNLNFDNVQHLCCS